MSYSANRVENFSVVVNDKYVCTKITLFLGLIQVLKAMFTIAMAASLVSATAKKRLL